MSLRDNIINEALSWVGYLEKKSNAQLESKTANAGYNNYTIFAKWYMDWFNEKGYQPAAWCAMFVSDIIYKGAGYQEIVQHFAYCPNGVNWFKKQGRWYTSNPQIGDVIFYTNGTRAYHTGLVYNVDSTYVYTVEGNTSSKSGVVENGGAVETKKYKKSYSKIMGYGRPPYENYESKEEDTMIYYQYVKDMPKWAQEAFTEAIKQGIVAMDSEGAVNVPEVNLQPLVWMYRASHGFKD